MSSLQRFAALKDAIALDRAVLVEHPLYARLHSIDDVRVFMEHHVFAVWDFMSLLKSLQRELTCVDVPWIPRGDAVARRLVNEIVLGEESDDAPDGGGYTSHFELYRAAMVECGANTDCIDDFVARLARGESVQVALARSAAPIAARKFVEHTWSTVASRSTSRIASAFTLGREDVIPDMFRALVRDLNARSGARFTLLVDYLERHVALDGERHGPMSVRMLEHVCADDAERWSEALEGARGAIRARVTFWTAIEAALGESRAEHSRAATATPART